MLLTVEHNGVAYAVLDSAGVYNSLSDLEKQLQTCLTEGFLVEKIFSTVNLFEGPHALYCETEDGRLFQYQYTLLKEGADCWKLDQVSYYPVENP